MKWLKFSALVGSLLITVGCVDPMDYESQEFEAAIDGPWVPDADLVEQSMSYDIPYIGAGAWVGTGGCGGSFLGGTQDLREWLYTYWPQVEHVGGYSCRPINGNPDVMSVHATGRAIDIHIPLDDGQADNDLGDPLANYLIEHAQEMGIQIIIWDRWKWSMGRQGAARSQAYTGAHPHHDHLHVELTPEAADRNYPWWDTAMEGPDLPDCSLPLPKEGGQVDNSDKCFTAYGPAEFWRTVDGEGVNGSLRWTNAWQTDSPSNWARWNFVLSEPGVYRVEYNSVAEWAVFNSTRYAVAHNGQEVEVTVDQSAGSDGWNVLGEFEFDQGGDQWVSVYDDSPVDVPADQHVIADAVRLVRADLDIDVTPDNNDTGEMNNTDPEKEFPDPPDTEIDGDPEYDLVEGEGGCATAKNADPSLLLLLLGVLIGIRRRRR